MAKVLVDGKEVDIKTLSDNVTDAQEIWIAATEVLARAQGRLSDAKRAAGKAETDVSNAMTALERARKALDSAVNGIAQVTVS